MSTFHAIHGVDRNELRFCQVCVVTVVGSEHELYLTALIIIRHPFRRTVARSNLPPSWIVHAWNPDDGSTLLYRRALLWLSLKRLNRCHVRSNRRSSVFDRREDCGDPRRRTWRAPMMRRSAVSSSLQELITASSLRRYSARNWRLGLLGAAIWAPADSLPMNGLAAGVSGGISKSLEFSSTRSTIVWRSASTSFQSRPAYQRWEKGATRNSDPVTTSLRSMIAVAQALGVGFHDLLPSDPPDLLTREAFDRPPSSCLLPLVSPCGEI